MSTFPINRGGGKSSPLSLFACTRLIWPEGPRRSGRFLAGLFFCAFFSVALCLSPAPLRAEPEPPPEPSVQIVKDQDKGTVTFIIDGKAVAQIDKDGLHVVSDIVYGGTLTDAGSAYVEQAIAGGHDDAP